MALHRATSGSEDGFKLFRTWSAASGSPYYTEAGCRRRWDAITGCPPTWIGARFIRRMAIEHGWSEPPPAPEAATPEEEAKPEPTEAASDPLQAEIDRLAALTELDYDRIDEEAKAAIAEKLGLTVGALNRAVGRVRKAAENDAEKAARDGEKAAKAKAAADAKAAKAEAKAREKEAKEKEREARAREARARLNAQKTPQPLTDDDDDPLREWIPPDPATLPEIIVAGGERPANADAGLAVMKAAGVPFYQRGKDLVRVCRIRLKQSNGKMVRVPAISTVTKPMMLRALGLCAKWLAFNKDLDLVQIDPPGDLADHILGMIGEWPFPPLRGVIATQTMRYDGSLLTEPGYDRATGLVLFNPPPMPVIPDQPTKADALESLALLRDLLAEVDFAEDDGVSLSGAMSMLMTPVLRGMMAVAPMHVVTKPAAGTGGSYMGDIAAAICLGEPLPGVLAHAEQRRGKREAAVVRSAFRAADHRHRQLHRHPDGRLPVPTDRAPDAANPASSAKPRW